VKDYVEIHLLLCTTAGTAVTHLSHCNSSICLFVHPSHGWISQKRCKLGLPNFYHRLPGRLVMQCRWRFWYLCI